LIGQFAGDNGGEQSLGFGVPNLTEQNEEWDALLCQFFGIFKGDFTDKRYTFVRQPFPEMKLFIFENLYGQFKQNT
jgi:hypothetical protein